MNNTFSQSVQCSGYISSVISVAYTITKYWLSCPSQGFWATGQVFLIIKALKEGGGVLKKAFCIFVVKLYGFCLSITYWVCLWHPYIEYLSSLIVHADTSKISQSPGVEIQKLSNKLYKYMPLQHRILTLGWRVSCTRAECNICNPHALLLSHVNVWVLMHWYNCNYVCSE